MNYNRLIRIYGFNCIVIVFVLLLSYPFLAAAQENRQKIWLEELNRIEKQVNAFKPNPAYPDDPFILVTLKEAIAGSREENGGIGACLVREDTGEIVETGHNRQFEPYHRSDLHAEMDLLNRYEEKVRTRRLGGRGNPSTVEARGFAGIVLYSSVEPCPMCLTRIINAGIKKVLYAASDETGGMAQRISSLPPFWSNKAKGNIYRAAECSPELVAIAKRLFHPMGKLKNK
ncbi:MAG TPA: nucleoside deaminase [Syntrophorhabdaceae bacterium]|nr:tRNA-specific adenosine deaminase [Syntrophorhabdaceae bacterium]HNQ63144.1 nucleoside deaminase [Syntrophorhabdaceae bacterium]HNZ58934.1 nucleoside deaminase [Syntrophorhabdaceae bacterium]HOB69058.1 nucleoside deaminase [Syntrophorhabdaceae bacterium]HOG40022.1 nucleoside deaminase [Syntrophorhabdaceae bacterium]